MCFPCTGCGACGKYDDPDVITERDAKLRCYRCGAELIGGVGTCPRCGKVVWAPPGVKKTSE